MKDHTGANAGKFIDPMRTAKGEERARVALSNPQTLWFNTGTLCNIECINCYIESSPKNDALVYMTADEVSSYLEQLQERKWGVTEIGFTGGEPFMNPEFCEMLRRSLARGYEVLVLTNAMQPMQRKSVRNDLAKIIKDYPDTLTFRVSLDHYSTEQHDAIRGKNAFARSLDGMIWLRDQGAKLATAGRMLWDESEEDCRAGYAAFFAEHGFNIDAQNPAQTVLFPEMDETVEVPEITTECWSILDVSPSSVMCASSRMVVKRKGAETPAVLACTLLPYDAEFELGSTLAEAEGDVALNHPHCAKFCVLGGASCSG
ncbi:radical SAM protein [Halocynthiibacter sp. C4]|uniref:radical SAM protein n=1 Tax=Halocynthiibacter sp. C4 TaxID=2992758 RepID=UPI00237A910D|nr:radical SAM protein [Halocynthiibacter sp. C4]MDE0589712.1 radical SAM protein [Halocynthiibacter sp. C4]